MDLNLMVSSRRAGEPMRQRDSRRVMLGPGNADDDRKPALVVDGIGKKDWCTVANVVGERMPRSRFSFQSLPTRTESTVESRPISQPQFWGRFAAMRRVSKAFVAEGAHPVRDSAQPVRDPVVRLLAMRHNSTPRRHLIDEANFLSGASTPSRNSEDRSAEVDAEAKPRSTSLRWDATSEEFTLVHGTGGRRELYQRQQIPILEGEPKH